MSPVQYTGTADHAGTGPSYGVLCFMRRFPIWICTTESHRNSRMLPAIQIPRKRTIHPDSPACSAPDMRAVPGLAAAFSSPACTAPN